MTKFEKGGFCWIIPLVISVNFEPSLNVNSACIVGIAKLNGSNLNSSISHNYSLYQCDPSHAFSWRNSDAKALLTRLCGAARHVTRLCYASVGRYAFSKFTNIFPRSLFTKYRCSISSMRNLHVWMNTKRLPRMLSVQLTPNNEGIWLDVNEVPNYCRLHCQASLQKHQSCYWRNTFCSYNT